MSDRQAGRQAGVANNRGAMSQGQALLSNRPLQALLGLPFKECRDAAGTGQHSWMEVTLQCNTAG